MSIFATARFATSAADLSQLPGAGLPEIAFAGRSNAGKSTTINVLTGQGRLAFASKTPGRTQLINFFSLTHKLPDGRREDAALLVDLPGYGFAKAAPKVRETWSRLVGGYLADRPSLVGVVIVMDARRPFMPTDEWLINFFSTRLLRHVRQLWLINKCDQIKREEQNRVIAMARARAEKTGPQVSALLFSGLRRTGVPELEETLLGWIDPDKRFAN